MGEHMLVLASALGAMFDVVLACPPSPGGRQLLGRATHAGVAVKLLDDGENTTDWLVRQSFALMHVHAGIGWEGHSLVKAARAAGVGRIVRTEHLPDMITEPVQRAEYLDGIAGVDRVICVSEAAARSHAAAGVDPDTIAVIHNGVEVQPPRRSRKAMRNELGLAPDQPTLLTVARFTPQKDHATLIRALALLAGAQADVCLLMAGDGPLWAEAQALAEALGVSGATRFLGTRLDVPDLLAAADLFVLPSRFEGLPLVLIEAMAAGRPVVSTQVGGVDELVVDGQTGRLVPPGDAPALADAIAGLIRDPGRGATFGIAGRDRFAQRFTARRMAEDTARLYRSLGIEADSTVRTDGMARTRIGFIGAGGIAHRHLGVLERFEDVEIAAFADLDEGRARGAAERFGAKAFTDFETMLAAEPLDAVYICVPPFAHGAPERAALARNIPFFVEKPLAIDLDTAEAIGRAVEAAGLVTACGYHWRYLDTVDEARGILADNPAQFLSGYWLDSTPPPQWWWKQDRSGGQMVEQTTHLIDLARYLVGDVTQVFGLAGHKPREGFPGLDVATASTASLRFASGAVGNIGSTCLLHWNHRVGLHLFGEGLAIELTDHDMMVDVGRGRPVRHAEGDPVWREDRDFVDAVRGGENRIRCPYAEALKSHRISMAILRSAREGRAIDLAPAAAPIPELAHV